MLTLCTVKHNDHAHEINRNSSLVGNCRDDFANAEYCALLGSGNTSHGYCKRADWPPPFFYARYLQGQFVQSCLIRSGKKSSCVK